ncbi:MAG: DMT family transporter [Acidimicrobiia bacterium]
MAATVATMPLLAALLGAVAISFSAIFFELSGVEAITGAFFRVAYALPILVLLWWRVKQRDNRSRKERLLAVGAGIVLGGDFISWHLSIHHIGAGLATLLANCQVVIVAVLAWVLLGEKPSRRVIIAVPIVLAGVALVSGLGRSDSFGSDPLTGTLLALSAAFFYAFFLLGFRRSNRVQAPAVGPLMDATAGALISTSLAGIVFGGLDVVPGWPSHGWLVALALVAQVGGWLAIGYALPRLPAAETSTFILIQPVLTMAWGAIIFSERPSPLQLSGAALVLAGVGMVALATNRRRKVIPATS